MRRRWLGQAEQWMWCGAPEVPLQYVLAISAGMLSAPLGIAFVEHHLTQGHTLARVARIQ